MRDIVERLRDSAHPPPFPTRMEVQELDQLLIDAADEIEKLRREIDLLRQGLAFEKRINEAE